MIPLMPPETASEPGYYIAVVASEPLVEFCTGMPGAVVLAAQAVPPQAEVAARVLPDIILDAEAGVDPASFVAGPFADAQDALDWYAAFEAPTRTAATAADALAERWQVRDPVIASYFRWLADDRRDLPDELCAGPSGSAPF